MKRYLDLLKKAAPKLKEAAETAKDVLADIKTKGALYQKTGHNTTEARHRLAHSKQLKDKAISLGYSNLNNIRRNFDTVRRQNPQEALSYIQAGTQLAADSANYGIFTADSVAQKQGFLQELRHLAVKSPKHSRNRKLLADYLNHDRNIEHKYRTLVYEANSLNRRVTDRMTARHGNPDEIIHRLQNRHNESILGNDERASDSGFEAYLKNKYGKRE